MSLRTGVARIVATFLRRPCIPTHIMIYEISVVKPQRATAGRGSEGAYGIRAANAAAVVSPLEPGHPIASTTRINGTAVTSCRRQCLSSLGDTDHQGRRDHERHGSLGDSRRCRGARAGGCDRVPAGRTVGAASSGIWTMHFTGVVSGAVQVVTVDITSGGDDCPH